MTTISGERKLADGIANRFEPHGSAATVPRIFEKLGRVGQRIIYATPLLKGSL
jgi:hypothetical protein